ncbi:peptidase M42 [Candidatus Epulonipiscium fishelsonii]|uniref:Peptidase M42 n=1 Tax=Candidatus Epulonipiscium fishelsonii TaxID=77094 RepID=A0ACC8XIT7_9FIRM|nr:peptidase M42 [Epulopiscium sp. SCG-D08WGA-EpuloA1]OON96931.1 MAG: peptidase M42 [Epulopiscium sp. AS2M-Bin002]
MQIDSSYMLRCFEELIKTPSPVGYFIQINPIVKKLAKELGFQVTYDRRHTAYIEVEGEDNSKTVLVGGHLDTLGMTVRRVEKDGTILVRQLGGLNHASIEGETVTIHTRCGKEYTGVYTCKSHSVHVFDDARSLERSIESMMILIDMPVKTKEDVYNLGIRNGDIISIDPHFSITPNGYIKSRFIDDKGAVATIFTSLKYLVDNNLKPKYRTLIALPHYEEIGYGGSYIPSEVEEFLAIDIGLIGPDYEGNEFSVSICAQDATVFYDWDLTNRLIEYAKKANCDYVVDTYYRYGTDAGAAIKSGHNVAGAVCGMAVYNTHGVERTNIRGFENTTKLIISYLRAES